MQPIDAKRSILVPIVFGLGSLICTAVAIYRHQQTCCPIARLLICRRTPFHNVLSIEEHQNEKEKVCRAWMEKYVA